MHMHNSRCTQHQPSYTPVRHIGVSTLGTFGSCHLSLGCRRHAGYGLIHGWMERKDQPVYLHFPTARSGGDDEISCVQTWVGCEKLERCCINVHIAHCRRRPTNAGARNGFQRWGQTGSKLRIGRDPWHKYVSRPRLEACI
jgi:hypothetical protein